MTDTQNAPPTNPLENADGNALVARIVALRDMLDTMKANYDAAVSPVNSAMTQINEELARRLHVADAKSMKFDAGTATRVDTQAAFCHDWEAFNKWVLENQRLDVFPRKLNMTPFKEMLEADEPLPPGVQITTSAAVRVRRSTSK
jgi:hypothetical protein